MAVRLGGGSCNGISLDELLTLNCPSLMKSLLEVTDTFTDDEPERINTVSERPATFRLKLR